MRLGPAAFRALQALARQPAPAQRAQPFAAAETRRHRALEVAVYRGFLVGLVFSVVTAFGLNFNVVSHAGWASWARVAVGAFLIAEGLLIAFDWQGSRRLLLRRLYTRTHGADGGPPSLLRLGWWKLVAPALVLVGALWVGVGAFELAQGVKALV
jgi:hypothetical protein